jgi:formylglycine-generating enzyme required for sulfatase activity
LADIFLSYAREDIDKIKLLASALKQQGWSVFWDSALLAGQDFHDEIEQEIEKAGCMIVAWSSASRKSAWVKGEAIMGEKRKILVPIKFDSVDPPINFISLHTENFTAWNGDTNCEAFNKLQRAVARKIGTGLVSSNIEADPVYLLTSKTSASNSKTSAIANQSFMEPELVVIPSGQFEMGSNVISNEQPIHTVTIAKSFSISKYLVTFDEFDLFANAKNQEKPSDEGWGRGKRPVINVSWKDASAYASWLSKVSGKTYRLLSEAEWEYATRAGSDALYFWGDDANEAEKYAWFLNNSEQKTHPVGEKLSNGFGLYDMTGNVWEWVEDDWHKTYGSAPTNGSAWHTANNDNTVQRVLRGGSFQNAQDTLTSAHRYGLLPFLRYSFIGFRLAQE